MNHPQPTHTHTGEGEGGLLLSWFRWFWNTFDSAAQISGQRGRSYNTNIPHPSEGQGGPAVSQSVWKTFTQSRHFGHPAGAYGYVAVSLTRTQTHIQCVPCTVSRVYRKKTQRFGCQWVLTTQRLISVCRELVWCINHLMLDWVYSMVSKNLSGEVALVFVRLSAPILLVPSILCLNKLHYFLKYLKILTHFQIFIFVLGS